MSVVITRPRVKYRGVNKVMMTAHHAAPRLPHTSRAKAKIRNNRAQWASQAGKRTCHAPWPNSASDKAMSHAINGPLE